MLTDSPGKVFRSRGGPLKCSHLETLGLSVLGCTTAQGSGSQSAVWGPAVPASPGNVLEMLVIRSHHRPSEWETLGARPTDWLTTPPGDWVAHQLEAHCLWALSSLQPADGKRRWVGRGERMRSKLHLPGLQGVRVPSASIPPARTHSQRLM